MFSFILTVHIITCLFLIVVVLFQVGKGANMSTLFGGGGSDAIFGGASGGNFFKKVTAGFAIVFMLTSLTLAVMSAKRPARSLMDIMPPKPVIPEDILGKSQQQKTPEAEAAAQTEKPIVPSK
ncbi:preprotein translocase subunit SecG [bacterium]